ncbi:Exocellobiohydrolase [Sistotremastrum suecicum HHB10207 ss-3]|uniref:Glucanase n=1 Tax=Sistotremastrum suecicum HHB10207 ss-3 TaxID=1314776 RepID=A0A165YZ31_9AGAM|nr:Exocellobiohydrolase [Sistotremastrum suecicum HHB10207 ss-3]
MFPAAALFALSYLAVSYGQQVGTNTAETHPSLQWQTCTAPGACTNVAGSVVLDANWRWLHSTSGYTNCYTGNTWDATLCPDAQTCATNCALDGADYTGTYGVTTSGNALTLKFVTNGANKNVGSRLYLLADASHYQEFKLLNREFSFDVDVSQLPCGLNGALYFSEMAADGGASAYPTNKAGAKYGTGYCDSQCPRDLKFIDGLANVAGWTPDSNSANSGKGNWGSCCNEMDIWEGNSISEAVTPHPCNVIGQTECTGTDCSGGMCDPAGCDFNSYRMGNTTFYGPGSGFTIDTTKKITAITQFFTADGTDTGTLSEIRRIYIQNNVVVQNSVVNIPGIDPLNSITEQFCTEQKTVFGDTNTFEQKGGLAAMGQAFGRGMVLVLSIWDDYAVNMLWLDSDYPTTADPTAPGVARGTCSTSSGAPADVEANSPNAQVIYSNIKFGPIGSTYNTGSTSSSSSVSHSSTTTSSSSKSTTTTSSTKSTTTTTSSSKSTTTTTSSSKTTTTSTTSTKTSSSNGASQTKWGQCGGIGYTGPTACSGSTCTYSNPYYSQCL